ncbi:amidohydrolase [Pseudalkalibacillus decolorationis]|uniref:amidohydrolase n=1 Tax=Pseudalkalibacillus decolorationis TaxID=163879 RepID=UPI0021479E69|nr:amidohydrolase [Pseudalkalibacillus decolorationis]
MTFLTAIILSVLLLLSGCTEQTEVTDDKAKEESDEKATLILKNGSVYTMEDDQPSAEAVAVKDSEIIFVGNNTDVEKYVGDETQVIDLEGKMVSPGFMDGHTHPPGQWTTKLFQVDLTNLKSHEEYIQAVADFRKDNPDAKIITGRGWKNGPYEQTDGTNPGPKKEDLDAVVSDIPVILNSIDGHSVWVNSKALEMAGINENTEVPKGGMIEQNPDGSPRGVLREGATDLLADVQALFNLTKEQYKQAFLKYQEEANSFGITGILNMSGSTENMEILHELEEDGQLTMRVANAIKFDPGTEPDEAVKTILDAHKKYNSDWLQINTAKLFADGVTEGKTALFLEPYTENAGMGGHHHGEASWKVEAFNKMVSSLDKEGIQLHIHAIGDGAVNTGLNAFEDARKANGERDSRHTITHISAIQDKDITRMAEMDVIASMQPFWFYKDQYYKLEKAMVGKDRALEMYPARKMWDAGVTIASSSDYPPTPDYRPLNGIEIGVTRNSPYPEEQDTNMVRNAAYALTVEEMLQSFTKNVAYQLFREDDLGSIKVGKKADIVVLGQDITKSDPKDISETKVAYTIVDGKIVYEGE